ncbi:uncharacterized protein LOC144872537 isoform X2 [Branchiostoma floridae x Branchiostoma japonicum]
MNSGVSPRRPPLAPKPQVPRKPAVAAVKPQPHPKPKPVTDVSTSTKPTPVTAISTKPEVTTTTPSPQKQLESVKNTPGSEERPCEVLPALQAGTCTVPPNEKSSVLPTDSNVDQIQRVDAAKHGKEALNANSNQEKVFPTSHDSESDIPTSTTVSSTSAECVTNSDRTQEPSTDSTPQQSQSPTEMSQPPVPKPRRISSELPLAASNEDETNALQQLENAIDTWEAGLSSEEEEEKDDGGVLESKDKDTVEQVVTMATAEVTDPGETCDSLKDMVTSGDVTNHVADETEGRLDADVANLSVENVASSSSFQTQEKVADVNSSQEKNPHREDGDRTVELSQPGMQDQENADLIAPPRNKKKSKFVSPTKPPPPPPPSKKPSTGLNNSSSPAAGKLTFVLGSSLDDHEKQTPEAHVSKKQGPHLFSPHDAGDFKVNSRRRLNKPRAPPCPLKRRSRSLNSLLDKADAEKLFHSDSAENLAPLDRGPPPAVPYKPQRLRSVDTPNVKPAHATLIARSRSFDSLDDVTPTRTEFKKSAQERPRPVPAPRRLVKAVDVVKEEGDKKETPEVKAKEREGSKMVRPPRRPPPPPFLKQKAVSAGNVLAPSAPGQSKTVESIPSVQTPEKPAVQKSTSVDSMSNREYPTLVDRTKGKTTPRPESSEEVFLPNSSELESTPVQGSAKKGAKKTHFSSTIASGIRSFFEKTPSKNKDADGKRTDKPVLHIPPPPVSPPEDEEDTEKKEGTIPEGTRVDSPAVKPARPSRKAPAPPRPPPIAAPASAGTSESGITTPAATSESTAENNSPSKERSSGGVTPDEPSKERSSSSGGVTPDKPSKERSPSLPAPFENIKEKLTMRRSSPNQDSTLSSEPKRESFIMRKLSRSKSKGEEDRKKVVPKSTFYIPPPTEETPSEADTENAQSSPSQHRIPPPTSPPPKPPLAALKPTVSKTPSRPPPPAKKLFEESQDGVRTSIEDVSKDSSARNSSSYVDMNISGGSAEDLGTEVDAEYMDMDTSVKADSSENLYQNKLKADSTDNLYMNQEGDLYKNETAGDKTDDKTDSDDYEEMGAASLKREEKQEEEQEDAEDHYYSMPKERPEHEEEKTDHTYDYADPQHTDDSSDYAEPEPYANPTVPNTDDHEYHEPVLPPNKAPEKDKTTHYYSPVADDTQTQTKVTPKKSKPPRPPPPKPTTAPAPLKLPATPPPKPPRSPGCVGFPEDRPPAPLPRQSSELLSPEEEGDHSQKARLSGVSEASSNSQVSSEESGSAGAREEAESSEEEEEESSSDEEEGQEEESKADIPPALKGDKAFYIAREIMSSEEVFVDVLKLLNEDFRSAVDAAGEAPGQAIIEDATMTQILMYLPQLQQFNESLLKDFKERVENWEQDPRIADVIVKKGPYLKLYTTYIRDFEKATSALDEACRRLPKFAATVKEFQMSPRCANLAVKHYMLKPIQRIPQYKMLLDDYLKHLTEESPDYKDTKVALSIVSEVADHANEGMKQGDNFEKLLRIQHSLIGQHEIVKPGRKLLKEGMLKKLSRKEMQPRMFFLMSDALLYCTPIQGGMYKLNNLLQLAGMKVMKPVQDFLNELSIISVQRSFTLSASSSEERDDWMQALTDAIRDNAAKRSTFDEFVRHVDAVPGDKSNSLVLGYKAPVWIPDSRVTMCMGCTCDFTVTWRRHHCRACGKVVCGTCSANRAPLQYLDYKAVRVCEECYERLSKEFQANDNGGSAGDSPDKANPDKQRGGFRLSRATIQARFKSFKKTARKAKKSIPSVLKEVTANNLNSDMSGYLQRKTKREGWRKLWFVLKDKVLYTYKASEDVAALESLPLLGFTVTTFTEAQEDTPPDLIFKLAHQGRPDVYFRSDDKAASKKWVAAMMNATVL